MIVIGCIYTYNCTMVLKDPTSKIAFIIKDARKKRRLSQSELAKRLNITQARYSQIENGKGSFSAEQLIDLVRFFNIPLSAFEVSKKKIDEGEVLQNAVAYFGGQNLYETQDLLPSEKFDRLNAVVFETLIASRSARLLTGLAVVIIKNIYDIDFNWIESRLIQRNCLNRWGWLLENTLEALKLSSHYNKRTNRKAIFKISRYLDLLKLEWEINKRENRDTLLDKNIESAKTINMVLAERSEVSKRWNILSRIQVEDFKKALDEGLS